MAKSSGLHKRVSVADDYLRLVKEFPLRPIRTQREHDAAMAVVGKLAVRDEGTLTPGEQDYLDALTAFLEMYDESCGEDAERIDPLTLLRELMEHRGMSVTDLGALFGSKGVASDILRGKRPLTLRRIYTLAAHFRVDPAAFVPRP